jgi:glycosyltransferase involved in cell wall biosynthesis
MKFGIVISSYKYGHLAAHAIESVLAQKRAFDKIWFVDDGVGDCNHLIKFYGDRIDILIRDENFGILKNFNDMLDKVDTKYVMFLGADNWIRPDTLELIEKEVDKINGDEVKIIMYDIMVTGELRNEIYKDYSNSMWEKYGDWYWDRKGGHHGSMMYEVETSKKVGKYEHNRATLRTDEDHNLWNKFMSNGYKSVHIEQGLLYYRRHKENFNKY